MNKRTHVVIPEQLVTEIDSLVGKRGRSQFLTQAAWREVKRLQMLHALNEARGAWKDKDHPELKDGAVSWITKERTLSDRRLQKVGSRK